jgi:PAS domain S-box-containing protein
MSDQVNILLVDDRPENLLALEAILEPLGQRLVRALSGTEALRKVLTEDFACILLDVQMPGLNGFETAKLIKARERSRYIPIIFLTAISKEEEYVFQGYQAGAVDYMFKPFQPDILRSKVMVFVDLYLKQQQITRQEQLLRESEKRELELRHVQEMRASALRMAEVVDSAMDAIISFDDEGRITLFNTAAEQMFCVPAAETVGREIASLFPEEVRETSLRRIRDHDGRPLPDSDGCASVAPASSANADAFVGLRSTGDRFPLEASISSLELPEGRLYTIIARDVSERRRQDEALREQAAALAQATEELKLANHELHQRQAELERAMSARSRFYASMSHELRTPINAILGYSTLMLESIYGPLNERQQEGIARTHKAAKHLLELVNDVLDLSKIEAGKIDLKPQPVGFPDLIEDLFVTVKPMADQVGSELTLQHEGSPRRILTDPRRVRQILLNLLSNAIKFGQGKPIHVRSLPRDVGGMAIEVTDHGAGIPSEDIPRIFDEFVQLSSRSQHHEGTGLGLPISMRLATLLRGRLEVRSQVGAGSTFTLLLPETLEARTADLADMPSLSDEPEEVLKPLPATREEPAAEAGRR